MPESALVEDISTATISRTSAYNITPTMSGSALVDNISAATISKTSAYIIPTMSGSALVENISAATISKTSAYTIFSMSVSALVDDISAANISTTSKTMSRDLSLMNSSPKPTGNDVGIEDEPDIDEGSGNDSDLNLLLISTVTLGGKCMEI